MLDQADNEMLTRVGPGTPMGELLRRYWHPVAAAIDLKDKPTKRVRILGEDLALYKDRSGNYGLITEHCPHRRVSLAFGIPEFEGIRCPYHGWMFDGEGNCIEQPGEPAFSRFKENVQTPAYPVQELGGLLFAYMGPRPAPFLPLYDYYAQPNSLRQVAVTELPVNWLQVMENSLDPVHAEWLHAYFGRWLKGERRERGAPFPQRHHLKIGFDRFEYGIIKRRMYEGRTESDTEWSIGHPVVFPNILKQGDSFQVRVPIDDENTLLFWYDCFSVEGVTAPSQTEVPVFEKPYIDDSGEILLTDVANQDMMAWLTQGPIADRTKERLGSTDEGVILYRKLLRDQMAAVERGEDPICTIRDPAKNLLISLPNDHQPIPPSLAEVTAASEKLGADTRESEEALRRQLIERGLRRRWASSPIADELVRLYSDAAALAQ